MRTMFFNPPLTLVTLSATALLWFPTQSSAAVSDVTQPTDLIVPVHGVNDGDGNPSGIPAGESVDHAIDNVGQKYLNFADLGSGFDVQPGIGHTIVTGLRFYTANDAPERDPASYTLEGATSIAGPWTAIASGALALPAGRNPGGSAALGANFQEVTFANSTPYGAYRVTFPTLKNAAAANSMQISEVELLGIGQPATLADFIQLGRNRVGSYQYHGASADGESYTIVGGGNDIWDRWDEGAFAFHEKAGDFDIRVRVTEIEASGQWSKAGIYVTESFAEDSKRVMQSVSPCGMTAQGVNGACTREFLWRTGINAVDGENGGNHSVSVGNPAYPNAWIRMVRTGSVFTGYGSDNGVDWTQIATTDSSTWQGGALPGKVWVGLAVSRHPSAGLPSCRAVFANYQETTQYFGMVADSKGCPDKILLCFNRPYGPSALVLGNYELVASDVFPVSVEPGPNPNTVCLNMEGMTEGFVYQIRAKSPEVMDAQGNSIDANANLGTFTHAKGFEKRKIHVQHNKIDGASLAFYEQTQAYSLGQGAWTLGFPPFESNILFEDPLPDTGSNERFSSKILGVLSPAADGSYRFACSSDDQGKLFISTDDQPANKVLIATEPDWNGSRQYATCDRRAGCTVPGDMSPNVSAARALLGGAKYYLEYIYAEGGGGNNGSATWDAGSGTPFVNGQSPLEEANFIESRYAYGNIFYNLGGVVILTQPQDRTAPIGASVTFAVTLDGTPPYDIVWKKNGGAVAGASGTTFTISSVQASDNGAQILAEISNACGAETSTTATLTVLLNPRITGASSHGNCHEVCVTYNKAMLLDGTYSIICSNNVDGTTTPATLSGIRYGANSSEVCFDVSPDLLPDTNTYYVTVTGAHSADGLVIDPDPQTVAFVHGAEYPFSPITFKRYTGFGYLQLDPSDVPVETRLNQPFLESPSNIGDNYVGQTYGTWIVPATGTYKFWMAADDPGRMFISTDANPASKVEMGREPQWAGIRQFAQCDRRTCVDGIPQENQSPPFALTAGQRVYLEVVFEEFGGGDNSAIAASYDDPNTIDVDESRTPPANGALPLPASQFVQSRIGPNNTSFTTLCDVFCNPGPSDQTVYVGQSATFSATPDGTPPYTMQWFKNGVAISGATGSSYTTPPATLADDLAVYKFEVRNAFSMNMCEATLHVLHNPLVVRCETRGHTENVYVTYNKPVLLNGTYAIVDNTEGFPVDVTGVAYGDASHTLVVLTTSGLPPDHAFTLTITDVQDEEMPPNTIVPNPTICPFGQGPGRACYDFNDNLLPPGTIASGTVPPTVESGYLALTHAGGTGQQNFWTIPLPTQTFKCLSARWKSLLNGPIGNSADGYSFNVGVGPFTYIAGAAEEGGNNGLSVTVDTFDNGGAESGIEVRWNGARLAFTQTGGGNGPAQLIRNQFVDASVEVSPSGFVRFNYDTFTVSAQIPNFTGINANRYEFGARTGGAAEDAFIDDVCINDYTLGPITVAIAPVNPTVPECSTVTFTSTVSGSPCHFYQWSKNGVPIAGATEKTYTTPPLLSADDGAVYRLTVNNEFSSAFAESTVDVTPDNNAPTIVSVGALNPSSVGVCFSEPVDAASATSPANYKINAGLPGEGIASVTLRPDGKSVIITLSTPLTGCNFTVMSTGVLDACPARNSTATMGSGTVVGLVGVDVGTPGDPAPPGGSSVSCADETVEIIARGSDMWGNADHIQFAYQQRMGDFDVQAKVERLDCTAFWAKAGIAARVSLSADSPAITTYHTPVGPCGANQIESGARLTFGGGMGGWEGATPRPAANERPWIRLTRSGSTFRAYSSTDGATWILHADSGPVPGVPATLFVGLFATPNNGNNAAAPTTAVFRDVEIASSLSITRGAGTVTVTSSDPCAQLQSALEITGPWTPEVGTTITVPSAGPKRFFRACRPEAP